MRTLLLSSLLLLAAVGCSDLDGASPTEGAGGAGANGGGTGGTGTGNGGGSSLRDCTTALQCLPGEDCVSGRCERIAGGGGEGGSGTGTGGSGTGGSGTGGSGTGTGGSGTGGSGTGGSGVVDVPCARTETLCDGADDDCNGQVDEICSCSGASQECFLGPAGARGVGACTTGRQLCAGEFWAECVGSIGPHREVCNGLDDDCDGVVDDGVQPCGNEPPNAICPPDMTTTPLRTVPLAGNGNDPDGRIVSWRWDIIAKPLGSASVANPASAQRSEVFLDIAGGYTARLTVTDDGGASDTCDVDINAVPTERFRVEMLWNFGVANDSSDVDLHLLHPSAGTTDWFNSSYDCYYANCVGGLGGWGNQGQTPRLDLDDVQGNGPENINIDQPAANTTYTVGVHYYDNDGMGDANVIVKIWCEGAVVKEFEGVSMSASGANSSNNDIWRVADVTFAPAGGCTLREYGSQGARDVRPSSAW